MRRKTAADEVDRSRAGYLVHDARSAGRDLYITTYIEGLQGSESRSLVEEHLNCRTAEQAAAIAKVLRESRRAPDCSQDHNSKRTCERGTRWCTIVHADFDQTVVERLEAICGPAASWVGRCNALACAMIEAKLASGQVVFGVWTSTVANGVPVTPLQGGVLHSWIERPDGTVVDPTRWVFEGREPYVYEGPADYYSHEVRAGAYKTAGNSDVEWALRSASTPSEEPLRLRRPPAGMSSELLALIQRKVDEGAVDPVAAAEEEIAADLRVGNEEFRAHLAARRAIPQLQCGERSVTTDATGNPVVVEIAADGKSGMASGIERIEPRAPATGPAIPVVHVLLHGLALCGFTSDMPVHWPPGHRWVHIDDVWTRTRPGHVGASCQLCVERARVMRNTQPASRQSGRPNVPACFCPSGHQSGHNHWAGSWPTSGPGATAGRCASCGTINDVHIPGCQAR